MAKTLVEAAHPGGPFANGTGGCHTRWHDGLCSGTHTAEWLNSLGEDEEPYGSKRLGRIITCGEVRRNWLTSDAHIRKAERRPAQ